ncbi:hypothetical protein B0H14DRAFT_3014582 [Mycena olivaceomarginata]|nr:hypothetical protein B0H14DRAFT_3014582 [Mycena olivaceomarginata]
MDRVSQVKPSKRNFNKFNNSSNIIACSIVEADIELREKKFELAKFRMAIQMASDILGNAYRTKSKLVLHKALLCLGDVIHTMDIHCSRAQCMIRLGDLANEQGHTSKAISLWQTARPLFEQSFQATDVSQIDVRLSAAEKRDQKSLTTLTAPDQWLNTGII